MRLYRWSVSAVVPLLLSLGVHAQAVRYEVSISSAAGHLYHVKAEFPTSGQDTLLESVIDFDITFQGYNDNYAEWGRKVYVRPQLAWTIEPLGTAGSEAPPLAQR